jgi:ribonuclease P protein subunit RPR2
MGKAKASKIGDNVPQKHLHSRISFLHQASALLVNSGQQQTLPSTNQGTPSERLLVRNRLRHGQSRELLSHIHGIAKKSQIRLGGDFKHTICKRCESLLVAGVTSIDEIKNDSRDGMKPWADVFEVKCKTCGTTKRFPVGQTKGKKDRSVKQRSQEGRKVKTQPVAKRNVTEAGHNESTRA